MQSGSGLEPSDRRCRCGLVVSDHTRLQMCKPAVTGASPSETSPQRPWDASKSVRLLRCCEGRPLGKPGYDLSLF